MFWITLNPLCGRETLWRVINNKSQVKADGTLKPGFFRNKNGLSCDLALYTTRKRCLRGMKMKPWPVYSGLVGFDVESVRQEGSDVKHKPLREKYPDGKHVNYAHCQFTENLTNGESNRLIRIASIVVKPDLKRLLAK